MNRLTLQRGWVELLLKDPQSQVAQAVEVRIFYALQSACSLAALGTETRSAAEEDLLNEVVAADRQSIGEIAYPAAKEVPQ